MLFLPTARVRLSWSKKMRHTRDMTPIAWSAWRFSFWVSCYSFFYFLAMPLHVPISILKDQKRQEETPLLTRLPIAAGSNGCNRKRQHRYSHMFLDSLDFPLPSLLKLPLKYSSSVSHLSHILFSEKLEIFPFHFTISAIWHQSCSCYICC